MFFTERLALLIEAGIPLHSSLETLERQASASVRQMIRELRVGVSEGLSLSQALARQPETFNSTYSIWWLRASRAGSCPRFSSA